MALPASDTVQTGRDQQLQSARRRIVLSTDRVMTEIHPVSTAIQDSMQSKRNAEFEPRSEEFSHLRYTAVICDPNSFTRKNGYELRPILYKRETELVIAITYHNEGRAPLNRTLQSVMQNVRGIRNLKGSEVWPTSVPAWQKIVVCLIFDGVGFCDQDVLNDLAALGVYKDGIMEEDIDGKTTTAHVFEYTTQRSVATGEKLVSPANDDSTNLPPVQILLCLKQHHTGKVNSHRWLYSAFARMLNPEIIICVDAGIKLHSLAILSLWDAFQDDKNLAAASGQIQAPSGVGYRDLLNPIIAAQTFEYKANAILERPFESFSGYLKTLESLSAYRFSAIMGRPLELYFRIDPTNAFGRPFTGHRSNYQKSLYTAADCLLCFEIAMKAGARWHLGFINSVKASIDIPKSIPEFIAHKSKCESDWFISTFHALVNFPRIYKTRHSYLRMVLFHVQAIYGLVSLLLAWFGLAAFLVVAVTITGIMGSLPEDCKSDAFPFGGVTYTVNVVIQCLYAASILYHSTVALGIRWRTERLNRLMLLGVPLLVPCYFAVNILYLVVRLLLDNRRSNNSKIESAYIDTLYNSIGPHTVWVFFGCIFAIHPLISIIHLHPWHILISYPQYLFLLPTYANILTIYALGLSHDVASDRIDQRTSATQTISPTPIKNKTTENSGVAQPRAHADTQHESLPHKETNKAQQKGSDNSPQNFRRKLVIAYVVSNFFLGLVVCTGEFEHDTLLGHSSTRKILFFRIWMCVISGCYLLRFTGSFLWLVEKVVNNVLKGLRKRDNLVGVKVGRLRS